MHIMKQAQTAMEQAQTAMDACFKILYIFAVLMKRYILYNSDV